MEEGLESSGFLPFLYHHDRNVNFLYYTRTIYRVVVIYHKNRSEKGT